MEGVIFDYENYWIIYNGQCYDFKTFEKLASIERIFLKAAEPINKTIH